MPPVAFQQKQLANVREIQATISVISFKAVFPPWLPSNSSSSTKPEKLVATAQG
jgi:hypothetical protein